MERVRTSLWLWARDRRLDHSADGRSGATAEAVDFFRRYDAGFRIRRLRLLARRLVEMAEAPEADLSAIDTARAAVYDSLAPFLEPRRSDEHTSELQSLMRISYTVFCMKKKKLNMRLGTDS